MIKIDHDKVIKAWKIFRDSNPFGICFGREFRAIKEPEYCMGQMIEDTIALLEEQNALLNKAYETLANMDFDFSCDDLMCDDGWCEEHCEARGTKPECIERWLKKQVKKEGDSK